MTIHVCETCGVETSRHPECRLDPENCNQMIPHCCPGCGCQTFEELHPDEHPYAEEGAA